MLLILTVRLLFRLFSLSDNMVVFLHGGDSCSGMVGIEHGSNTYWLSGSNETWNRDTANIVCQQKHCGQASNFTQIPNVDQKKNVWDKFLNCSSKDESLFDCEQQTPPPGYNNTIANVTCSGNVRHAASWKLNWKLHSIYWFLCDWLSCDPVWEDDAFYVMLLHKLTSFNGYTVAGCWIDLNNAVVVKSDNNFLFLVPFAFGLPQQEESQ